MWPLPLKLGQRSAQWYKGVWPRARAGETPDCSFFELRSSSCNSSCMHMELFSFAAGCGELSTARASRYALVCTTLGHALAFLSNQLVVLQNGRSKLRA